MVGDTKKYVVSLPFAGAYPTRETFKNKEDAAEAVRQALEDSFHLPDPRHGFDFTPLVCEVLDVPEEMQEVVLDRYRVPLSKKAPANFIPDVTVVGNEVFESHLSAPPLYSRSTRAFSFAIIKGPLKR